MRIAFVLALLAVGIVLFSTELLPVDVVTPVGAPLTLLLLAVVLLLVPQLWPF